jgi:hypothetical protein
MINSNATEVAKSIEEYKKELERKLINMVAGFAGELTQAASDSTRIGDVSNAESAAKYVKSYKRREKKYGIKPIEGFHKGAWVYSEGVIDFDETIYPVGIAVGEVISDARTKYKLGDSFTIGAKGPAYEMLQKEDDIEGEALKIIMNAHKADLPRYFNEG